MKRQDKMDKPLFLMVSRKDMFNCFFKSNRQIEIGIIYAIIVATIESLALIRYKLG